MNINARTDYQTLFSGMNKTGAQGNSGDLSGLVKDYNLVKSGSYGKLMKAYYTENGKERLSKVADDSTGKTMIKSNNTASETEKKFNKVVSTADSLQKSVDSIAKLKDDASEDEIYSAVNSFVKDYNNLLDNAKEADASSVNSRITSIKNNTKANSKTLAAMGITEGEDGKLSVDKEKLSKADKSSLDSTFGARGSYGYSVSVSASMAASNANYEATRTSMYNGNGGYNTSTGSIFESMM